MSASARLSSARDLPEEAWRHDNVGRAIFDAARRFERDVLAVLAGGGFPEVRLVHLALFRSLDAGGTRLTELAARANMTKQGMGELVDRVEALALVERKPDPNDRRAKTVTLTTKGLKMLHMLGQAVLAAEREMAAVVGEDLVRAITAKLGMYASR